jgi:hypothetical protein
MFPPTDARSFAHSILLRRGERRGLALRMVLPPALSPKWRESERGSPPADGSLTVGA